MKKKLLFAMAAGAMLFATSCQNDLDVMGNVGDEALVSFTVTTPEMVTRAYSDGLSATHLQYAVYQGESELRDLTVTNGEIHGTTTVNLQLATGNTYTVLFWAAAPNAPYRVDFAGKTMTVDYNGALSNDEARDAFYAKHTFTVTGAQTETVKLYRPFAQLNIGTADYEASEKAGYVPTKSQVKVATYNTLNLWDGSVAGETTCTYAFAAIPNGEEFPVDGYEYLAMNYVLVGAKQVVDVEFAYTETDANAAKTRIVGSVPVQRNYRTNIYGNLLTSMVDINVEIVPEYNEPALEADALFQAAAFGGEVTLTEDVTLTTPLAIQANATINLGGKTLTGIVTVAEGVQATISNGKIVNTDNTVSGITSNGDLTLNDVEVESARHALRIESGNAVINGGIYKVAPNSNKTLHAINVGDDNTVATVLINDGTFVGPKGTMADSGSAVNVRSGSEVKIAGGNFSGGKTKTLSNGGTLVVTGGTFDQNPATYVAGGYTTLENNGTYTVIEGIKVENTDQLETVISNAPAGSTIVISKNINNNTLTIGEWSNVTIVSEDNTTKRFVTTADSKIKNVTLKNISFNFTTGAGQKGGAFVVIDAAAKIENLVIDSCNIVGDGNKSSYGIYGQNPNASIVVKNCRFSNLGYAIQATAGGGYASLTVEECSFENINSWVIMPQYGYNGNLTVNNNTFKSCSDGIIKTGAFNGSTFTFTNNTITNSAGHDGKDSKWFEVNASAATKVISGNTKDGADWTPGAENGLK